MGPSSLMLAAPTGDEAPIAPPLLVRSHGLALDTSGDNGMVCPMELSNA